MSNKSQPSIIVTHDNTETAVNAVRKFLRWRFPRMFKLNDILQQLSYHADGEILTKISVALKEKSDVIAVDDLFSVVNGWILLRIVLWVAIILMSFGALCSGNVKDQVVVLGSLLLSVLLLISEFV
jgi:hypothetical protein